MRTLRFQQRWCAAPILAGLGLGLMSIWLALSGSPAAVTRASYDILHRLQPGDIPSNFPVAIVYLDLQSHLRLNQDPSRPWARSLHAQLLRRLTAAGATAVVFDILFEQPGPDPEADRQFAEAVRAHGKVILGAEWNRGGRNSKTGGSFDQRNISLPAPTLRGAAASYGFVFSKVDSDFEVREHFPGFLDRGLPSLTWATAQSLHLTNASPENRWLHYYGAPLTIPNVSFADALEPAAVPDEFFRGKVIFVGARPEAGRFDERRDELRSPFSALSKGVLFMPGVEVHATQFANLLRQDWLFRPRRTAEALVLAGSGFLFGWGLLRLRPLLAVSAVIIGEVIVLTGAFASFQYGRVWFPWLVVSAIQIPAAWLISIGVQSVNWYSQKRRYQKQIREQAALIDKASDAIIVHDLEGELLFTNPKARELYGNSLPSILSTKLATALETALEKGEWTGDLHQIDLKGRPMILHSHWTLIRDENGQPSQLLQVSSDVTEKKKLEDQFIRAQRLEAIWALAGGMAHDLNSALAPVVMGLQRLRKRVTDQEQDKLIAIIQDSAKRGVEMVQQVLDFARERKSPDATIGPEQLLKELEQLLAFTFPKSISVSILAPPDLWTISGNATQLHQVLLNLCINARDAMPGGGQLTLAADNVTLTQGQTIPEANPGEFVMFLVADTGPGISSALLPRLFEPFATAKSGGKGTGLGLFTSLHVVRGHGGFIKVKSEDGAGATFEIYLPRHNAS